MEETPRPSKKEALGDMRSLPMSEPEFPNLTAMADFDRQQHIQKSIEAGLSREQAEKHADEHLAERDETRR